VNQGRDVKVGIYDDIVNIVSPGSLPSNITIEDIFNGRSEARNRVIAHIFKELGLIEQWGSGINRIINACKEQGLPTPKIEEKNDFFDVEIIRPVPTNIPLEGEPSANDYERLRTITND
jgi:ATP-dependent DNA helicase RecG